MTTIASPFPQFFDLAGSPLTGGKLYFGQPNQHPITAPIGVFWDAAFTQPAAQPVATLNGYPVRAGTPALLFTNGDASMLALDARGQQIFYAPTAHQLALADELRADLASTSNIAKGADLVGYFGASLADWFFGPVAAGADATGVASAVAAVTAADIAAAAAGRPLHVPPGTYLFDSSYTFTAPVIMSPGAKFKVTNAAVYLKFNAGFTAGLTYCLDVEGPTQFLKTEKIIAQWFGCTGLNADDQTTGMIRAFRGARASADAGTSHPGADQGARIVYFPSGVYRGNDVPVYAGTIIEGEWQGSLFGSTLTQIDFTKPLLRFVPKNYSVTGTVLNNGVGQNYIRRIGFRSEVASSVTEGAPLCYLMSPAQATTYLGIAGDTAGTVGHIDTFFSECWWKDGNTCIMADEGMLWVHVLHSTFDVCRRAVQHKGTARGRVNSRGNIYYGMTWGALDNQSSDTSMGVSWESDNDEFKAGNTPSTTADYRRALNYNPTGFAAGTSVRIRGSHFRRTDGLGIRIGGPIFIKNCENVDLDVWMFDPDSTNNQKAVAIQDNVKSLRLRGTIISADLASYTTSRLVSISQSVQTLRDIVIDLQIDNRNASAIETAVQSDFVLTEADLRLNLVGNFTNRTFNISGKSRPAPTVASAAAVTLPPEAEVVSISGTTGITSITATGWAGRTVRLVFQGALTVTDGGNLRLAGNFVTTADDVLTLTCDGTNWFEVARSVN